MNRNRMQLEKKVENMTKMLRKEEQMKQNKLAQQRKEMFTISTTKSNGSEQLGANLSTISKHEDSIMKNGVRARSQLKNQQHRINKKDAKHSSMTFLSGGDTQT